MSLLPPLFAAAALLCLVPLQVQAQPAPPGARPFGPGQSATYQDVMREAAALQRARRARDALALLSAHESDFAGDPYFDYQLGVVALEAGEVVLAQQALERAVLVRPDFAGAWVDLALAHARLGEAETALQIVAHIEGSFDVPLPLRQQLSNLRGELAGPRMRAEWMPNALLGSRSGYLQLSAGRDSNANLGLAASVFSLTPVGAPPLLVEIPPSARAAADAYMQLRGDLQQTLQFGEWQKGRLYLSGQYKEYGSLKEYSLADAAFSYAHEYSLPKASALAIEGVLGARLIATGGNRLATISTAGVGLVAYAGACRWGARLANEVRDYGLSGYVDADVPTISLSATCRQPQSQIGVVASFAQDDPRAVRAGGRTDRIELGVHYARQLSPRVMMIASGTLGHYRDARGYSPLLANGAVRQVARSSLRLSWLWEFNPARPEWALQAELERLEDRSNLDIFDMRNDRVAIGIRYQY